MGRLRKLFMYNLESWDRINARWMALDTAETESRLENDRNGAQIFWVSSPWGKIGVGEDNVLYRIVQCNGYQLYINNGLGEWSKYGEKSDYVSKLKDSLAGMDISWTNEFTAGGIMYGITRNGTRVKVVIE
jgi:hypothetical protein